MKIDCAHDKIVPIDSLKAHPRNTNEHPKQQIDYFIKVLEYQGQRKAVVVSNLSKCITKGHGLVLAAKAKGEREIAVDYQDYEDEAQEYADIEADNQLAKLAVHNFEKMKENVFELELDKNGFDLDLLGVPDLDLSTPDEARDAIEDDVPEATKSISKLGDIYELGEHRLLCGDSTDKSTVEMLMSGEKADMVFTDPPYGLADKWSGGTWASNPMYSDAKKWDQPLNQSDIDMFITLAKDVVIWGGNYYTMPPSRCWLSWTKSQQMETMADFELAWTNLDKVAKSWTGARNADGKRAHPTQKPVALMEWGLSFSKGTKILDLFGGSGSTLIACEKTKRRCFMLELDPHYIDIIISRWCKYTGKKEIKRNGEPMEWLP